MAEPKHPAISAAEWLCRRRVRDEQTGRELSRAVSMLRRIPTLEAERGALKETLHDEMAENLALRELGGAGPDEGMTQFLRRVIAERDAQRLYARKLCKAIDAIADFAGTVAGGASWWDDVWRAHELDLDAARSALGAASDGESAVDRAIRLEAELQRLKDSIQSRLDEEREACADEADHWLGIDKTVGDACDDIAAAIRARKGSK